MTLFEFISELCKATIRNPHLADTHIHIDPENHWTDLNDPEFVSVHDDGEIVLGRD